MNPACAAAALRAGSRKRALWLAALAVFALAAQQSSKRPLHHNDYDAWRSISGQLLSPDGRFLAYSLVPQEGNSEVVVLNLATGQEKREWVGSPPPPPEQGDETPEPGGGPPGARRGVTMRFTSDSRFLVSTAFPSKEETEKARRDRRPAAEASGNGLVIFNLASGAVTRMAGVRGMQVPERGGSWVAYQKEAAPADRAGEGKGGEQKKGPAGRGGGARAAIGTELVIRELAGGAERTIPSVGEYSFAKDGRTVLYSVASRKEEENGVFAVTPGDNGAPATVLAGRGRYTRLTWDNDQKRAAFLSTREDAAARPPKYRLYLWDRGGAASEIVSASTPGFREGFALAERAPVAFSRDDSRVFLGAGPASADADSPETPVTPPAAAEPKVLADLWHWRDDYVQPMQRVRANQERGRSYRGVYHIAAKKFVQLGDATLPGLAPSDDGRYAFGTDDRAYRSQVDYDGTFADYYLVDTANGNRTRILDRMQGGGGGGGRGGGGFGGPMSWSPDGKYAVFYRDRHWYSIQVPSGVVTNLTGALKVAFHNEDHDSPSAPGSYGSAGWTKDGKWVLLYDRYDIWQAAPDGTGARNLTDGVGRREKTRFRVVRLDANEDAEDDARGIDPSRPLLLSAENLETRDSGFWRDRADAAAAPEKLIMGPRAYRALAKAREGDVVLITATTFADPADLHVTDSTFRSLRRVTEANPQRARVLGGLPGEMIRYHSVDGVALQGALFKPENFDPKKKYPLMVYIYERLSQGLHNYSEPRPGTSINTAYYVSNGYLVLMPDIAYKVGSPGQSALKCVLPAVQAVVDRGYVNENAIGIQGHSWGGYQIAYMVTQTNRFRAAEAGAPVGNMTSAYSGIRWGTGLPRQFQYEKTQSRIGGTLWQAPMKFLENSPVFMADRVNTPLLILHNDADDAVPWYQGIELFLALRRNGKEAYLMNYNGERHGLRQRHNQKDWTIRMQQFFDHYLKGAPKPEWMERGIPFVDREKEKERLRPAASPATSSEP